MPETLMPTLCTTESTGLPLLLGLILATLASLVAWATLALCGWIALS